jgi:hydroxyethylthiazole kinase
MQQGSLVVSDSGFAVREESMELSSIEIWNSLKTIRIQAPLVHNITNYVVMNITANALLAIGASPVMAHACEEVEEMADIAGAVVINIGTLSKHWIEAMFKTAERARKRNIPVVFDPVGSGATKLRTDTARDFVKTFSPAIIRGNASEIMSLDTEDILTKGVDSSAASSDAVDIGRSLNGAVGSVVCISGETDYIIDGNHVLKINNGHPMMQCVTGMGCTATVLCGAFAAVEKSAMHASAQAMAVMGIAGEMAVKGADGPASFQHRFIDILYGITESDIAEHLKWEE